MLKFHGKIFTLAPFFISLCAILPLTAHAQYTFFIDEFSVIKNGNVMFIDSFDDGDPPPDAPDFENGNPAEYFVRGTMGPETGSILALDSSGTVPRVSPLGEPVLFQGATLLTSMDESDLDRGLKIDDTFSVSGVFDLVVPSVPQTLYGVRFTDGIETNTPIGNDFAELSVHRTAANDLRVLFRDVDFELGAVTIVDSVPLETNHDQIWLNLMRGDVSSNAITASLAYIDDGVMGDVLTSPNTLDIFDGENFTRAQFVSITVVPEPISLTLFITGGTALGCRRFWKKRSIEKI